MIPAKRTAWITTYARELGFNLCGVAPIGNWPELEKVPEWLERGYEGEMRYLHDARRQDPASILSGARSVIVCALNYNTNQPLSTEATVSTGTENDPRGWISRYAWGTDYHSILMQKLESLLEAMRLQLDKGFEARIYVDTGPILERVAATHAGLGWLGKNTCLINRDIGSWLFLGVILTTLDCAPSVAPGDLGPADLCGNCTLCLDACPTEAITEPYVLDARRCISYLTIELRGFIPQELRKGMGEMVFGCDICQDICPWNRRAPYSELAEFLPRDLAANHQAPSKDTDEMSSLAPSLKWLASLDEQRLTAFFAGAPFAGPNGEGWFEMRALRWAIQKFGIRTLNTRRSWNCLAVWPLHRMRSFPSTPAGH
jgi:epoxyqueuosine reductase